MILEPHEEHSWGLIYVMAAYSNGKRLVWKASVTRNRDKGSSPFAVVGDANSKYNKH